MILSVFLGWLHCVCPNLEKPYNNYEERADVLFLHECAMAKQETANVLNKY